MRGSGVRILFAHQPSLRRARGAAKLNVLQISEVHGWKFLLSAARRLHAVVAQKIGHHGGIFLGLERAGCGQRHRLNHDRAQLGTVEM
jgi:hypothetical protein